MLHFQGLEQANDIVKEQGMNNILLGRKVWGK